MRSEIEEHEKIILIVKKHWLMLGKSLICLVLAVLFRLIPLSESMGIVISLGMLLMAVYLYFDWDFDIWVVTNRRVIDEWGVLSSNTRETPLDTIQNVDYHQSIIGKMLDYGDVEIRSAAVQGMTVNKCVASPKRLKDTIMASKRTRNINEDERECPSCAEIIKSKARRCRFCGEIFNEESN